MQLEEPSGSPSALRERLGKAALALLLVPTAAMAESAAPNQVDFTTLYYGEQSRVQVYEPIVRATRLFGDGQSLAAQLGIDVITGASPSGALPSGGVQTMTTASGRTVTIPAGSIPLVRFQDHRAGLDGEWQKPWGKLFTSTVGLHASREKDYQSLGVSAKVSAELMQKLLTVTAGGGYNDDSVFPVGGTPIGLSDGSEVSKKSNSKKVTNVLLGVSRVLTRRWIVSLDGSRTFEKGYLTEPYKVISLVSPFSGEPVAEVTDNRPSTRTRTSGLLSSAYHFTHDIGYASYRYYRDTWGIHSNTIDLKYRHDLGDDWYVEPHVRYYQQSAADFFTIGLSTLLAPPEFATADYRLGRLKTLTIGTNFAFHVGDNPAQWNLRVEYIRQAGDRSPENAAGIESPFDLSPPINTVTAVVGYSFNF
ncbi:MAG TPA: DUF3570 domain-containing protein [Thermoanaerobaculia bacterium]|nr:DUF3570 domain-containing protein [Thermoanaerobaculia bacterium]